MGRAAVFSFPSESVPQVLTKGPAFKLAPEPVSGDQTNPRVAGDDLAPCKEMLLRATAKTRPPRVCRLREEPRAKIVKSQDRPHLRNTEPPRDLLGC